MIHNQISHRIPRLNPFVFPSDTDFRFVILIVATLSASLSIYYSLYLRVPVNNELDRLVDSQCVASAQAAHPQNTLLDQKAFSDMVTQCLTPTNWIASAWIALSLALLLSVAGALYWVLPNWKIWRGGLKPLQATHASPGMMTCLADFCREAGVARYPIFLLNPYSLTPGGVTFGRLGQYYVALNSGLVNRFQTDSAVFRAVVLHELGHIRNADVDKTYFTVAIGWAFGLVALVPWILFQFIPSWHSDEFLNEGWSILVLSGLMYLTRNAILRTREVYADVRASVWDGHTGTLKRILNTFPRPNGGLLLRLLQLHPAPQWRQQMLEDTSGLFRQNFWDAFVTGVVAASVISDVQFLFGLPFPHNIGNVAANVLGSGLLFAFLIIGIVGLRVWRATFANQARGLASPPTLLLSLSLGLGLLFGQALSFVAYEVSNNQLTEGGYFTDIPSLTSFTWSSFLDQIGSILFWSILLLIVLWFFFRWTVSGALLWLKVASSSVSPRRTYWLALFVESIVLAILLAQFSDDRVLTQFAVNTSDPLVHDFLSALGIPGSSGGFAAVNLIARVLVFDPLTLLVLVTLWAYPLAAWLWRKRTTGIAEASWAFLDPSPYPQLAVSSSSLASLRPGLALGMGIAGGLAFCGMLVLFIYGIKLDPSVDEVMLLAVLIQIGVAAIVAGAARQLSIVHGLFTAFVAGCVMTLGMLVPNLVYSGASINLVGAWAVFMQVVSGGGLALLPVAFAVSLLANWARRLFQRNRRVSIA